MHARNVCTSTVLIQNRILTELYLLSATSRWQHRVVIGTRYNLETASNTHTHDINIQTQLFKDGNNNDNSNDDDNNNNSNNNNYYYYYYYYCCCCCCCCYYYYSTYISSTTNLLYNLSLLRNSRLVSPAGHAWCCLCASYLCLHSRVCGSIFLTM